MRVGYKQRDGSKRSTKSRRRLERAEVGKTPLGVNRKLYKVRDFRHEFLMAHPSESVPERVKKVYQDTYIGPAGRMGRFEIHKYALD